MKTVVGKIVGGLLLVAGIAAIWLWPKAKPEVDTAVAVRPVRSMVVTDKVKFPELRFPGKVKAGETRDLMFEVSGRLIDFKLDNGSEVKKGDVLARLDTRDFEADVKKAEAVCERSELTLKRYRDAQAKGGVSKEEVSKAEADAKTSEAQLAVAKKALESCVIKAPYDGVVAETYPEELDMVQVGQKILTIQSVDKVKFDVSVPEAMVISKRFVEMLSGRRNFVVFDSLPGMQFDVKFEEFTAQADAKTQTFTATFSMPAHDEFTLLPGMSVTMVIEGGEVNANASPEGKALSDDEVPFAVPTVAIGADSAGNHFVWKLEKTDKEGEYRTVRQKVELGRLFGTKLAVTSGLSNGDRIAVAGVTILTEGQTVTLWKE